MKHHMYKILAKHSLQQTIEMLAITNLLQKWFFVRMQNI